MTETEIGRYRTKKTDSESPLSLSLTLLPRRRFSQFEHIYDQFYSHDKWFLSSEGIGFDLTQRDEKFQEYYNSGRMMFKLAEALGRLSLAGREMTRLSGFTTRVDSLMKVLADLDKGESGVQPKY